MYQSNNHKREHLNIIGWVNKNHISRSSLLLFPGPVLYTLLPPQHVERGLFEMKIRSHLAFTVAILHPVYRSCCLASPLNGTYGYRNFGGGLIVTCRGAIVLISGSDGRISARETFCFYFADRWKWFLILTLQHGAFVAYFGSTKEVLGRPAGNFLNISVRQGKIVCIFSPNRTNFGPEFKNVRC
jgi:hypothetical protein